MTAAQELTLMHGGKNSIAGGLLTLLREIFACSVTGLASACSRQGGLAADLLDQHQLACYELAMASAELLAAENAVAQLTPASSELDVRLAMTFVVDGAESVMARLEGILLEFGPETALDALTRLRAGEAMRMARRGVAGGDALAETGRMVSESQRAAEIGHVALSEDLVLARDSFRRLARELVAPVAEQIHRENLTVPEALLAPLREMGVFGLSVPESYGGSASDSGDDSLMMIVVTEALSEVSLAAAGSLITRPEIMTRALLAGGTERQKAHWLPRIAGGDPLCAIAITEPDFGSDVAGLSLRATKVDGGWLLNGSKTWCTFAGKAGLLLVIARTNPDRSAGHRGLSAFLVEKPSFDGHDFEYVQPEGGGLAGNAIPTIGYRGMHSFDLAFSNVFVPDSHLIGEEGGVGKGFYLTMAGMLGGRLQTAARASGVMRAALFSAIEYGRDRKVFGRALDSYPLTQAKIARMAARYSACRQLAYAVGGQSDGELGRMQASLVKLLACRSAELITREALQIHGGMGYAEEMPVSRYFVDARVLSIFEGAEETLALKVIARGLLEAELATSHRETAR